MPSRPSRPDFRDLAEVLRRNSDGGQCVEVSDDFPGVVPVRDSKRPEGPAVVFGASAWAAFVNDVH
ncbi:hypothetical protein SMICM17S_03910 [Streptomyces microflavus]